MDKILNSLEHDHLIRFLDEELYKPKGRNKLIARYLIHSNKSPRFFSSVYLLPCLEIDGKMCVLGNVLDDRMYAFGGEIATGQGSNPGELPDKSIRSTLAREITQDTFGTLDLQDFWPPHILPNAKTPPSFAFHITEEKQLLIFVLIGNQIEKKIMSAIESSRRRSTSNFIDISAEVDKLEQVQKDCVLLKYCKQEDRIRSNQTLIESLKKLKSDLRGTFDFAVFPYKELCYWYWHFNCMNTKCIKSHENPGPIDLENPGTSLSGDISFSFSIKNPEIKLAFLPIESMMKETIVNLAIPYKFLEITNMKSWENFIRQQRNEFKGRVGWLISKQFCTFGHTCSVYKCGWLHNTRRRDCQEITFHERIDCEHKIHPVLCDNESSKHACNVYLCNNEHYHERLSSCAHGISCTIAGCTNLHPTRPKSKSKKKKIPKKEKNNYI